ncbi:MAG: hypothetical protein ABIN37_08455 [Burkholderiaceae bacterium]
MTDTDLDACYSGVCEALVAVGQDKAALFLATLGLSLISRAPDAAGVHALITQARLCCDGADSPDPTI